MKRIVLMFAFFMMLSGCAAQETFETVGDDYIVSAAAAPKTILLELPEEAASPAMQSGETAQVYLCEDYTITVEILPSGDLDETLRTLTGFGREDLAVMETGSEIARYDCVWSSQAEEGDMIGRAAVLDDGAYHYSVSVLAAAKDAGQLESVWHELFSSFGLEEG